MYFGGRFRDRGYGYVPLAAAAGHGMMLRAVGMWVINQKLKLKLELYPRAVCLGDGLRNSGYRYLRVRALSQ